MNEEIEEENELFRARLKYPEVKCDAIANLETEFLCLIMYQDKEKKMYSIKLDETGVTRVKQWCESWLGSKQTTLEGYG